MNDPEGSNLLGGVPPRSSPPETDRKQKPEELGEEHDPDAGTEDKKDPQVHTEGLTSPPPEQDKKGMNTNALLNFQHLTKVVKDSFSKKKPEDGPSRIKEFSENVETCISNLNQLRKKKQGSFSDIPPFRLFGDGTADLVKWNKSVDLTEIQDWRGCFTYNPYRRLLAVWSQSRVILYQFETKPTSNLSKVGDTKEGSAFKILPGRDSVFFSRDGANLYLVTDTSVLVIKLKMYDNCDKVLTVDGLLTTRELTVWKDNEAQADIDAWKENFRVIHLGYHEGYYEGMEDLNANTLFPDYVVIYLASANYLLGVHLSFETASNQAKEKHDQEEVLKQLATRPIELPWLIRNKLSENLDEEKVRWRRVSTGIDHNVGLLEVKGSQLKVSLHKFDVSKQRSKFAAGSAGFSLQIQEFVLNQEFNFSVNPDIIAESLDNTGRVILVSADCREVYQIQFNREASSCDMKSIIKLPENIKRVNNLSFAYQARFIVMNANIGELYLWALLNDGSYGKVMYLDLDHEFTSTYITPDLDFFLLASPLKIGFQYFDPLSEPLDYYTIPTATKVLLGDHKDMYIFDHENFAELNRMLVISKDIVVYLRPNQIFALDLNNDERFRTEDDDGSFKSHVIKSGSVRCFHSVELEPNRTWLIYLLYTKVGYVAYYDGDESVFEIYCLTSDAPDPESSQTPSADDLLERTTTLLPQKNLLGDEEASRYKNNVKQMKRNIRFGRVYEAVVPSSRPLNIKYAENVVIVHSKDDPMASCIKTFPAQKDAKKDNMCWMMRKRFNLFETLGIRNLESADGFLNLLNRDYGAIRPSSPEEKEVWFNENQEVSKPKEPGMEFDFANSTNAAPVLLNRTSIQVIKKESPTARKAAELAKGSAPRMIAAEPDLAGQVAKFFEEKDLLTDPEEAIEGVKITEVSKNKRSQDFSASRESIGGDRKIDQDSLDEGYNEMKITGIANHTGVKRPTAGAWYFFKISDILGGKEGRITVKKLVHIVHSKFAKLSPDSSLLMLYGYKGYELFRFYELDRANQEIPMTDKPDYRVTEAENLPNLIRRHETIMQVVDAERKELHRKQQLDSNLPMKDLRKNELGLFGSDGRILMPIEDMEFPDHEKVQESGRFALMYKPQDWLLDQKGASFNIYPLRYRWKDSYQISSGNNVVMSMRVHPHQEEGDDSLDKNALELFIAICYDTGKVQVLCQHSHKPAEVREPRLPKGQVSNSNRNKAARLEHKVYRLNLKLKSAPEIAKMLFRFGYDANKVVYLGRFEMSADPNNTTLTFIKLSSRTSVLSVDFDKKYLGLHLDFNIVASEVSYNLILRQIKEELTGKHIGFKTMKSEASGLQNIPFQTLLAKNLEYYYFPKPGSQTEKFGYELLENTFRAMNPSSILQDPRVIVCLIVLNKPDLIKRVIQNIGIGPLISNLPVLELVFAVADVPRGNSIVDVSTMYQELAKDPKEMPKLPEDWLSSIIRSTEVEGIAASPGTKAIFSQLIFGHTGVTVEGLTFEPDLSLVKLEEDQKRVYLPPYLVKSLVNPLLMENPANSNTYEVYRTQIQLDLTNGSDFSIGLFQAILRLPDSELRYKFKQLIMYKWRMVFWHSLIYTLVYLVLNVLAYLYFGYFDMPALGICLAALHILFILFDAKLYGSALMISSKDLKNWIDVAVHGFSLTICVISLLNLIPNPEILSYLKVLALSAVSVRGIIQLKMFSGIRALVMLMGQVIVDLAWVPFVFAGVLLLATTIYQMVPNPAGSPEEQLGFVDSAKQIFMLIFLKDNSVTSNLDSDSPAGVVRSIVLLLGGTILMQGVFNFVIAIFIQTFQRVKDDKEIYELRSLLLEIVDYDVFLRGIPTQKKEIGHYLFLVPVPKDGHVYQNEGRFDRINKMKDDLLVEIGKAGIEKVGERAKKTFKGQEKYIDQAVGFVKENSKETDPRIQQFFSAAQQVAQGQKPQIKELTNLVSLLGDATDGKVRSVIQKTKKAADLAIGYADRASNGEEQTVDSLIEVLIAMADATDGGGTEIGKQLMQLTHLVKQCVDQARELKEGRFEISKVIDLAVEITQAFGNKEIREKVSGIAGATKCILQEGKNLTKQGATADFESILSNLTKAADQCGAKAIAEILSQPPYKKIAKVANAMMNPKANLWSNSLDIETLIKSGCVLVNVMIDDEATKSKITKLGDALGDSATAFKELDFKNKSIDQNLEEALDATVNVIAAISQDHKEVFVKIKTICSSVRTISKIISDRKLTDVPKLVDGISGLLVEVLPDDQEKVKDGIKNVSKFVNLITKDLHKFMSPENTSWSTRVAKSLPDLLEMACELIKPFIEDDKIKSVLDSALLASRLVQSRVESFKDANNTQIVFETSSLALELLGMVSPQVKQRSKMISESIQMVERQYENLSNGITKIDIVSLLEDFGKLALLVDEDAEIEIQRFVSLSKILLEKYSGLTARMKNRTDGLEYITWTCQTVETICSEFESNIGTKLSGYCRGVTGLVQAAQELAKYAESDGGQPGSIANRVKKVDFDVVFSKTTQGLSQFSDRAAEVFQQATPVFKILAGYLERDAGSNLEKIEEGIYLLLDYVSKIDRNFEEKASLTSQILRGLFACVKDATDVSQTDRPVDLEKLIDAGIGIMKLISPEQVISVERFKPVALALVKQSQLYLTQGEQPDFATMVEIVARIVVTVKPDLKKEVQQVVDLGKSILSLASVPKLSELEPDAIGDLVTQIGQLFVPADKESQKILGVARDAILVITKEVKDAVTGKGFIKDPLAAVTPAFGLVKSVLGVFRSDINPIIMKVELTVLGIIQQFENYKALGKIDPRSVLAWGTDLLTEYSPELKNPARMIEGFLAIVITTSQELIMPTSDSTIPINWNVLSEACCRISRITGIGNESQIVRIVQMAQTLIFNLERAYKFKEDDVLIFTPILESLRDAISEFRPQHSRSINSWCAVASSLETELRNAKLGSATVIDTIAVAGKILSTLQPEMASHANSLSSIATTLSEMLKSESDSNSVPKISTLLRAFKPILEQRKVDEKTLRNYEVLTKGVQLMERVAFDKSSITNFAHVMKTAAEACLIINPGLGTKLEICSEIVSVIEKQQISIKTLTKTDLVTLVDAVTKLAGRFLPQDEQSKRFALIIHKTVAAVLSSLHRFQDSSSAVRDVTEVADAAAEILRLVCPDLDAQVYRLQQMLRVVQEEATSLASTKEVSPQALVLKAQRIISILSPVDSSYASRLGMLLTEMQTLLAQYPQMHTLSRDQMLRLAFTAVAILNPMWKSKVEMFVLQGLDMLESAAGSDSEYFLRLLKMYLGMLDITGLDTARLDRLMKALREALIKTELFHEKA